MGGGGGVVGAPFPEMDATRSKAMMMMAALSASSKATTDSRLLQKLAGAKQTSLGYDLDCVAEKAECLYQQHDAQGAFQLTQWIQQRDPFHQRCLTTHLACLVELGRKSDLFYVAHQLVDGYPGRAISWFALG